MHCGIFGYNKSVQKSIDNITCPTGVFGTPPHKLYTGRIESMLQDVIQRYNGVEVTALEVYKDIFRIGEGYIQKFNDDSHNLKANPLGYYRNKGDRKGHYRVLFEDTFEETLQELQQADFSIVNGITYFGRRNTQEHASKMYAMIFDLDGMTDATLNNFFHAAFSNSEWYPIPNYVITSGHGVHLYYLFEEPVPLFPNIKLQLKNLKYALTRKMWNRYTSTIEQPQIQGINQGFRVIGGKSKVEGYTTQAYRINTHPFSLEQLGRFVPEENRVDETKLYRESKLSLQDAKTKYPEWYNRVIIGKDKAVKKWAISEKVNGNNPYALYDWWIDRLKSGATYGHRYFCIMALTIYAVKCDVPLEKLKKDAYSLIGDLNNINSDEPFTKSDVNSALECYEHRYCTFPIDDISKLTAITIEKNKRNGRKQALHLKLIRSNLAILNEDKGQALQGRKPKQDIVEQWQQSNPNGTVSQCARQLNMSRTTVYKYWRDNKTTL